MLVNHQKYYAVLTTDVSTHMAAVLYPLGGFLSFFIYCTTPSRGLRAGGLRLKATVQKVYGKRKDKDDRVKKNVQEELKEG